jgi:uncharacterized protein YbcI
MLRGIRAVIAAYELASPHPEAQQAEQRKPLTEEQIVDIWADVSIDYDDEVNVIELARAIERAHGIKEPK